MKFASPKNADDLGEKMFAHWRKPPIFEDAAEFLSNCNLPYIIAFNIDSDDIVEKIYTDLLKDRFYGFTKTGLSQKVLDFHIHEESDEMFYCIEGEFDIEFEDGITHVTEGDFIIIPRGIKHRPVCKSLVKCLLIETEGTLNEENTGGTY